MAYTPTREVFERVIDALSFDLNAGSIPYGHAEVNAGLEPLESEVENVIRYDGLTYDAINNFVGQGGRGTNVFVGIGNPQGGPPFGGLGEPMNLEMPLEIVVIQAFGGADEFVQNAFILDDVMDDVFRCLHPKRRSPARFGEGVHAMILQAVGKIENEPHWYGRAINPVCRRDIRRITD